MRVRVGRISRAHGIRGEVTVEIHTDEVEKRFANNAQLWALDEPLTVERFRIHQGRLLVVFAGINDRNAAEALRGSELFAEVDETEKPDAPDEFYDRQLIGLSVRNAADETLGSVMAVEHFPAQDLLVIETKNGSARVPFVNALVTDVDIETGYLRVADVPGLLDLEQADDAR